MRSSLTSIPCKVQQYQVINSDDKLRRRWQFYRQVLRVYEPPLPPPPAYPLLHCSR
jgi:hypothetical protein